MAATQSRNLTKSILNGSAALWDLVGGSPAVQAAHSRIGQENTKKVRNLFMPMHEGPLPARVSQDDVAELYDRLARVYDLWGWLTEAKARKRSLALANVKDGQHVLEVAAGTGLAFVEAVKKNPHGRNIAIDISAGMLAKAERRLQNAGCSNYRLSVGSALSIPEADKSFDLLLNSYMFDLLEEHSWARALTEFHRVLKREARLVLVNMTVGERLGTGIYERLYRLSPSLLGGCRGVRLADVLGRHGFVVQLREYYQQLLFPSEVILATKSDARHPIQVTTEQLLQ